MNRLIAAAVLLAFLCGLSIGSYSTIHKTHNELYDNITFCEAAYAENGDFAAASDKVLANWLRREKMLSIFIDRNITDDIGEAISRLQPLAQSGSDEFLAECAEIKIKLNNVKKDSGFNLRSIF